MSAPPDRLDTADAGDGHQPPRPRRSPGRFVAAAAFTGLLIDRWSVGTAVLVVGALGILAALASWALARASPQAVVTPPPPGPSARSQADSGRLGGDEREPGVRPA